MDKVLLFLQQLIMPLLLMWPIWVLFLIVIVVANRLNRIVLAHWTQRLLFLCSGLLLVLRGMILVVFPYQNREMQQQLDSQKDIPLVVTFNNGELMVTHKDDPGFVYESRDLGTGFIFEKSNVEEVVGNTKLNGPAYFLHSRQGDSLLTKINRTGTLTVPSALTAHENYALYQTKARLDFTNAVSPEVTIRLNYSSAIITLPAIASNDLSYDINGGSQTSLELRIPENTPCELTDIQGVFTDAPTGFEKTSKGVYYRNVSSEGLLRLRIDVYNPKALAVTLVDKQ